MGPIFRGVKNIFFWRYGRSTWQYDVLCVLILVFVFLTPKTWFDNGKPTPAGGHQSPLTRVYLPVSAEVAGKIDRREIEHRVRLLTGRPEAVVASVQTRLDEEGNPIAYEIDIR